MSNPPDTQTTEAVYCDCERGHNGIGLAGRLCDCQEDVVSGPAHAPTTDDPNTPLRMHLALKMLRKWGMGEDFDGRVVATIRGWIDGGKSGPIPWPGGAFFEEWAARDGLANVDGFVGLRLTMELVSNG